MGRFACQGIWQTSAKEQTINLCLNRFAHTTDGLFYSIVAGNASNNADECSLRVQTPCNSVSKPSA